MADFYKYLQNLNGWVVIDILIVVAITFPILLFFLKKNSIRIAVLLGIYLVLNLTINIISAITNANLFYITTRIFDYINIFLIVAFVIVYQSDLKMYAMKIGRPADWLEQVRMYNDDDELRYAASEIVKATQNMSKNDVGAIIIIAPSALPTNIVETGTPLNALISYSLLESIFNPQTPLHDGAVVIKGNVVVSAGCFLPLSQDVTISKELGTRHRAAIGIAEESDVLAIVISEETGIISIAKGSEFKRFMTPEKLTEEIENAFGINYKTIKKRKKEHHK